MIIVFLAACVSNDVEKTEADTVKEVEKDIAYVDLTGKTYIETDDYWIVKTRHPPIYPAKAAKQRIIGCVSVIVGINSNGKAGGYKVTKSYPEGVFDKRAAAALSQWEWKPGKKNSDKIPTIQTQQLSFYLDKPSNKAEAEKHCGSF